MQGMGRVVLLDAEFVDTEGGADVIVVDPGTEVFSNAEGLAVDALGNGTVRTLAPSTQPLTGGAAFTVYDQVRCNREA